MAGRLSALGVAVVLVVVAAASASVARDSYCSPSGDFCTSAKRISGAIVLRLGTFSFTGRYRLCVRPPRGATTCRSFPLRLRGSIYESRVRWHRNFPNRGPGTYRVTWSKSGTRLGPTLSFVLATS